MFAAVKDVGIGDEALFTSANIGTEKLTEIDASRLNKAISAANNAPISVTSNKWIGHLMKMPQEMVTGTTDDVAALIAGTFSDAVSPDQIRQSDAYAGPAMLAVLL